MNTKTKKQKINNELFPFTEKQLQHLRSEIDAAGSFHELMFQKKALERKSGMKYIAHYYDTEKYKKKYLTGVYASLQEFYDTDIPFTFWDQMFSALEKLEEATA
jgi:hypothetical protein